MIRTVLAVAATVALVGLAAPAIDAGATAAGERQVERQISAIGAAALDLVTREATAPDGHTGARRVLSLRFPSRGFASRPPTALRIAPASDGDHSRVRYRVAGGSTAIVRLDAPVTGPDGGPVELGAVTGERTVVLALDRDERGRRVVRLSGRPNPRADDRPTAT